MTMTEILAELDNHAKDKEKAYSAARELLVSGGDEPNWDNHAAAFWFMCEYCACVADELRDSEKS